MAKLDIKSIEVLEDISKRREIFCKV